MLTKFLVEPVSIGGLLPATLQYRMLAKNKYLGSVYVFLQKVNSSLFVAGPLLVIQKL